MERVKIVSELRHTYRVSVKTNGEELFLVDNVTPLLVEILANVRVMRLIERRKYHRTRSTKWTEDNDSLLEEYIVQEQAAFTKLDKFISTNSRQPLGRSFFEMNVLQALIWDSENKRDKYTLEKILCTRLRGDPAWRDPKNDLRVMARIVDYWYFDHLLPSRGAPTLCINNKLISEYKKVEPYEFKPIVGRGVY